MTDHGLMPDELRLGVTARRGRLYVDVGDVVAMLRHRAAAYRVRAEQLVDTGTDPDTIDRGGIVPLVEEALACRMVAEELEQRADVLDQLG